MVTPWRNVLGFPMQIAVRRCAYRRQQRATRRLQARLEVVPRCDELVPAGTADFEVVEDDACRGRYWTEGAASGLFPDSSLGSTDSSLATASGWYVARTGVGYLL